MKKRQKNGHSFISNTIYMFKLIIARDKLLLPASAGAAALEIVFRLNAVSFITAITYCLENQKGIKDILLTVAVITAIQLAAILLNNRCIQTTSLMKAKLDRSFDIMLAKKVMDMDFDLIEGPVGREKYQKARNALSYDGVYNFVEYYKGLFNAVLLVLISGAITVKLNAWLILILTGLEVLKLAAAKAESYLTDKTKDPIAKTDRKLNYINRVSRDFAIGKDIRIYKLRNYLMYISEYFIGERKFWTNKMYFYYFCTDMLSLTVSVGIEIGIFAYIIYASVNGKISKTELVLFACSITDFTAWLDAIGDFVSELFPLDLNINALREFLDIKNSFKNAGGKPIPDGAPYEIKLKNISFSYPESETPTLKNINLTIKKGENLALVGVNGAGKTTLVKLICGLYRPTSGQILLNGEDISEFNRDDYYRLISAVFQEMRILPCTIIENVSMLPAEDSDRYHFYDCIKKSGLTDKINAMPDKENTYLVKNINENAAELSGGETQRLLLARALYKNAPILILDEPTAALDPIAENEIYMRYSEFSKEKTSVYISHRLSSTRFCDRIILLDSGTITESGTHDELMKKGGKYAEMFTVQSKYYTNGGE